MGGRGSEYKRQDILPRHKNVYRRNGPTARREKRNVFYALDRHIEAAEFDLVKALNLSARRRSRREPTKFDVDTCKFTGKWRGWVVPDKYKLRGEANIN